MEFEVKKIGKATVLRLREDIDSYNIDQFKETIRSIYKSGVKNLIVNLEGVRYISSVGLGVLVQFSKKAKTEEKTFKLVSVSPSTKEIMEITNMTKLFDIYDSEKEALDSLV